MILNKTTKVSINPSNIYHYSQFYDGIEVFDIIYVNISELTKSSNSIIYVKCDECGFEKELEYKNYIKYGYSDGKWLCRKCKLKKNNQEKYGVDNVFQLDEVKKKIKKTVNEKYHVNYISQSKEIQDKIHRDFKKEQKNREKTNLEKYGVSNVSKLEKVKVQKKLTCLKNYGVEHISQNEEFREKLKIKNLEKYGVIHSLQSDIIKDKIKKTNLEKYGVENPSKCIEVKDKISKSVLNTLYQNMFDKNPDLIEICIDNFKMKCDCGKNHAYNINKSLYYKRKETNTTLCTICNPIDKNISGLEIQLLNFIKENYTGNIIKNTKKIIYPYELDIYLPDLNLAFEFNGVYWHNEINKPNNYHKNKTDLCQEKGIQLIHIWEDDWIYKQEIIKSMIINKLDVNPNKILAENCEIKEIFDIEVVKKFLNRNHIKGFDKSKVKIGLYYKADLVSIICFSKKKNNNFEIIRFCDKKNYNIIGSIEKIFNYFIDVYDFNKILVYVDRSLYSPILFSNLNFKLLNVLKPDYNYVVNGIRKNKNKFKKSILVEEGYNNNLSEHEIMISRNIFRIYDSGYHLFEYSK
jgi:hypothetical protein